MSDMKLLPGDIVRFKHPLSSDTTRAIVTSVCEDGIPMLTTLAPNPRRVWKATPDVRLAYDGTIVPGVFVYARWIDMPGHLIGEVTSLEKTGLVCLKRLASDSETDAKWGSDMAIGVACIRQVGTLDQCTAAAALDDGNISHAGSTRTRPWSVRGGSAQIHAPFVGDTKIGTINFGSGGSAQIHAPFVGNTAPIPGDHQPQRLINGMTEAECYYWWCSNRAALDSADKRALLRNLTDAQIAAAKTFHRTKV